MSLDKGGGGGGGCGGGDGTMVSRTNTPVQATLATPTRCSTPFAGRQPHKRTASYHSSASASSSSSAASSPPSSPHADSPPQPRPLQAVLVQPQFVPLVIAAKKPAAAVAVAAPTARPAAPVIAAAPVAATVPSVPASVAAHAAPAFDIHRPMKILDILASQRPSRLAGGGCRFCHHCTAAQESKGDVKAEITTPPAAAAAAASASSRPRYYRCIITTQHAINFPLQTFSVYISYMYFEATPENKVSLDFIKASIDARSAADEANSQSKLSAPPELFTEQAVEAMVRHASMTQFFNERKPLPLRGFHGTIESARVQHVVVPGRLLSVAEMFKRFNGKDLGQLSITSVSRWMVPPAKS